MTSVLNSITEHNKKFSLNSPSFYKFGNHLHLQDHHHGPVTNSIRIPCWSLLCDRIDDETSTTRMDSKTNISVFSLSACSICFILSSCSTIPFVFPHSHTSLFSVYIHPVHTKHNMCCKKQHGTFNTLLHSNSDLRHFYAKKEAKKKVYRNKKTSGWERIPSLDLRLFVLQQKTSNTMKVGY